MRFGLPSMRQELGRREFVLLIGHSYDKPVASTRGDSLTVREAVVLDATLPPDAEQPTSA